MMNLGLIFVIVVAFIAGYGIVSFIVGKLRLPPGPTVKPPEAAGTDPAAAAPPRTDAKAAQDAIRDRQAEQYREWQERERQRSSQSWSPPQK